MTGVPDATHGRSTRITDQEPPTTRFFMTGISFRRRYPTAFGRMGML